MENNQPSFELNSIEKFHRHDGVDNYRINPKDLLGFPILSSVPTFKTDNGQQVYVNDGTYIYLYAMIDKVWTRISTASIWLSATATLNFPAINPNSSSDLTVTLTGAVNTNTVSLGVDNAVFGGTNCGNISFFAWVSAANTVTVRCTNHDLVNTANPASGTFKVVINQF